MSLSEKIDTDLQSNFGDLVSYELTELLKLNIDFMQAFCPVGGVAAIMVGIPGVPLPNPEFWQECDGSEITNPNSPLRTQGPIINTTPNLIEKYIRMPISFGQAGVSGGFNSTSLFRHNHGGRTGDADPGNDIDDGSSIQDAVSHTHTIDYAFPNPVNVEPPYYTVKFYMRIQ